jgi:hypothetical protein
LSYFDQNSQNVGNQFNIAYGSADRSAATDARFYGAWRLTSTTWVMNGTPTRGEISGYQSTVIRPDGSATTQYSGYSLSFRLAGGSRYSRYRNGTLNWAYTADNESCTQIADPFIGDILITVDGSRCPEEEEQSRVISAYKY